MADGKVLEFNGVTKVFGDVAAVSDLSARIEPGSVTAFLGPNGAGKTTTLRILLGQLKPTSGQATIGGVPFAKLSSPGRTVGAVGENGASFRPRRTAVKHLTSVARQNGISTSRVREVLDLVGLADVADMRIGGYSLGMRQRLSVAQALLGDPGVLVFDEPANGLDPEGIRWMRLLMRSLADEGRTVLMSSHLLAEVEQIADKILIMSNGNLVFDGGIEVLADVEGPVVAVDSPDRDALTRMLRENGLEFEVLRSGVNVHGSNAAVIGNLAADAGVALSTLHQRGPSLEDVFLDLVSGRRTQQTAAIAAAPAVAAEVAQTPAETAPEPENAPEPSGDPDAEVDLSVAAGTGSVAGLAGAAVVAAAADAVDDIEPLPGADAARVVAYPAADESDDEEEEDDESAEDHADTGGEHASELPTGYSFADALAEAEQEAATEQLADDPAPAPVDGTEHTDPASSDDDLGPSPWAVGPSFAERLGGAADARGDEPFAAEAVPSHLLETQAMDVIGEDAEPVEGETSSDSDTAEAVEAEAEAESEPTEAEPAGADADAEIAEADAIRTEPEGAEPAPTTQEIAFTSFVESFEGGPEHTGEVEVVEGEIVEESATPDETTSDDEHRDGEHRNEDENRSY